MQNYVGIVILKVLSALTYLIDPIVTLSATFLGAWFAFSLADRNEKRKLIENRVAAGNRALFVLLREFNTLQVLKIQVIDPYTEGLKKSDDGYLQMKPASFVDGKRLNIDADALGFMLETEERNILGELLIEEERFHHAIDRLNFRSDFHLKVIQPCLDGFSEDIPVNELIRKVGPRNMYMLKTLTDDAVWQIDQTVRTLREFHDKLHTSLKRIFPTHSFIRISEVDLASALDGLPNQQTNKTTLP